MSKTNILPVEQVLEQRAFADKVLLWNKDFEKKVGRSRKAFVLTFGCQQNEADSERLAGMASAMGYQVIDTPDEADFIIVNTCAIREHAELKALSTIGQYKHIKAKNPGLIIAVCGCMVAQDHRKNDIKFKYPYVDFIFGTSSIHRMPQLIWERIEKERRIYCPEETEYMVAEGIPVRRESNYKAWLSVMYGCNNFCSYCIVPYVRGRERSRRKEDILEEFKTLVSEGYKDITLLGQNVNSYGKDNDDGCDFADLLRLLCKVEGDYKIHFMTSHPKDATNKLIDVIAEEDHMAKHFHLPMQSGSDRVLKAMNRHYDTERYMSIVNYMREKIPDIAITSDIIVGFPGESEEEFEMTLEMLRKVRFDMLYSFIYSPRKGTPAAEMEDQIPKAVQNKRFERLLSTQNEIALEKNMPLVGKTVRVLCDGESKTNSALYSGRTEQAKIVFFEGMEADVGKFVEVRIDRAEAFALYGSKNN